MPTLKELLDEMEISIDDDEQKPKEEPKIDLSKLPEDQRKFIENLQSGQESLKNELSKRDIMIKAMQDSMKNIPKPTPDPKPEKILGVIDPDDPDVEKFKAIANAIEGLKSQIPTVNEEEEFQKSVGKLYKDHPDMVRYVKDMEILIKKHPTYRSDLEECYNIAKAVGERRESARNLKKEDLQSRGNVLNFRSESSGMVGTGVTPPTTAKTISDAFDLALKTK